jgi:hypothetical protein
MNIVEAQAALAGGADILDVKNPKEGSLGANFPWAIRAVADLAKGQVPVSATIGDLEFKPGTASLAALGAAVSGAEYVKAGLLGVKTPSQAEEMLVGIVRAVKDFDAGKKSSCIRLLRLRPSRIHLAPAPARSCRQSRGGPGHGGHGH